MYVCPGEGNPGGHPSPTQNPSPADELNERPAMSNKVTMDSLRESVRRKYAPVAVELSDGTEVVLRGIIRLTKTEREKVVDNLKVLDLLGDGDNLPEDDEKVVVDAMNEVLLILAEKYGTRLVSEIAGEVPMLVQVLETWMEASQLGEAEPSPNS